VAILLGPHTLNAQARNIYCISATIFNILCERVVLRLFCLARPPFLFVKPLWLYSTHSVKQIVLSRITHRATLHPTFTNDF